MVMEVTFFFSFLFFIFTFIRTLKSKVFKAHFLFSNTKRRIMQEAKDDKQIY